MNIIRYDYPAFMEVGRLSLSYREQMTKIITVLMTFLKKNNFILFDPFNEDGSLKQDLVIQTSDLTEPGNLIFDIYFLKWSAYIDRSKNTDKINNIKILQNGLEAIEKEHEKTE